MRKLVPILVLAIGIAVAAGAAPKPAKPAARPAPRAARPMGVQPIVSPDGLIGLHEVFLDVSFPAESKFAKAAGLDEAGLRSFALARLKKVPGLKIMTRRTIRGVIVPRLIVQVVGHTIPNYSESDPPAAVNFALTLEQPVFLTRPASGGRPIQTSGDTYTQSMFSTNRASNVSVLVKDKVGYLLDEFIKAYQTANPKR